MFSTNERLILKVLKSGDAKELSAVSTESGIAKSSSLVALRNLVELGVIEVVGTRSAYRIASRDEIERAASRMLADFREAVLPSPARSEKLRLTFTDRYVLPESMLDQLRLWYEVKTFDHSPEFMNDELFALRSQDSDIIVRWDAPTVDKAFLDSVPQLKAIVCPNCVVPNLDFEACRDANVIVRHADPLTEMYYGPTELEYTVNAILTLLKPIHRAAQATSRSNRYYGGDYMGDELAGKHVGLIFSNTEMRPYVDVFRAFGCSVHLACNDPQPLAASRFGISTYESIDELWKCDVLVILNGKNVQINELLKSNHTPSYLVIESNLPDFDMNLMRQKILQKEVLGLAIDQLTGMFDPDFHLADFQTKLRPLINLPNVLFTPELHVFSHAALSRSHQQVFNTLMDLELQ